MPPSIVDALTKTLSSKVQADVASLPEAAWEHGVDAAAGSLIDKVCGHPHLQYINRKAYSVGPDVVPMFHFQIEGSVEVFQEHLNTFLPKEWSGQGNSISIPVYVDREDRSTFVGHILEAREETLETAAKSFVKQMGEVRGNLMALARDLITLRIQVERDMKDLDIPKVPSPLLTKTQDPEG